MKHTRHKICDKARCKQCGWLRKITRHGLKYWACVY